jgi:uncharacterized membrane protein
LPLPLAFRDIEGFGPTAVNEDGSVVVGFTETDAVRWSSATDLTVLANPMQGTNARALAVSADGRVVVGRLGEAPSVPVRWIDPAVAEPLRTDVPGEAVAVSADGKTILATTMAGSVFGSGAYLWKDGVITTIDPLPGDLGAEPSILCADGSTVIGRSWNTNQQARVFIWTAAAKTEEIALPLDLTMRPVVGGASSDCAVVVGHVSKGVLGPDDVFNASTQRVFRWTRATGAVFLTSETGFATAAGVTADGVAVAGAEDDQVFFQTEGGARVSIRVYPSPGSMILDPHGRYLAGTVPNPFCPGSDLAVWAISATAFTPVPNHDVGSSPTPVAISADGHTLVTTGGLRAALFTLP